jgi:hypothetical protein
MYSRWLDRASNEAKPVSRGAEMAQQTAVAQRTVWVDRIVMALAAGALLGAVTAMPYDRLLGLAEPACTILRSMVTAAVWVGLGNGRLQDLTFDAGALQIRVPRRQ